MMLMKFSSSCFLTFVISCQYSWKAHAVSEAQVRGRTSIRCGPEPDLDTGLLCHDAVDLHALSRHAFWLKRVVLHQGSSFLR